MINFHISDWHLDVYGHVLDTNDVSLTELGDKLRRFYCEARPKVGECYHKNTLNNIRAAIHRHFQDIGRQIDIIRGTEFRSANRALDGMLKEMTKQGESRPTLHKPIIDPEDLRKIAAYFQSAEFSPVKLRQSVWYNLSVHFVSRGLEFHHQLRRDSFVFDHDDKGGEYVTLSHECLQKNFQGGLNSEEAESDKRMYATGRADCPLKLLRLLMDRTDHTATHLFNCCNQDALASPSTLNPWFGTKPLTKRTFAGFMPDVSKSAGCSKRYTAHSLRATAIQAMSDAGYEARHIMFMSGHRNESSIRSYSRNLSSGQKRSLSNTLSSVASATVTSDCNELVPVSNPTLALTRPGPTVPGIESTTMPSIMPHDMPSAASSSSNVLTSFQSSAGLLSNCSFANCNFTFNK